MLDGTELEILKCVRGSLYRRRRDAVLATTADMAAVLEGSRRQPDRRIEIIATILAAWKEHGPRYEAFFAALNGVDVAAESAKITGLAGVMSRVARGAEADFGEAILPLAWEQVLKFSEDLPPWQLETMFRIIGRIPSEASIEPLIWFVEQSTDPGQIDQAHQALILLPYEKHEARFREMMAALTLRTFVAEDVLARIKAFKKSGQRP